MTHPKNDTSKVPYKKRYDKKRRSVRFAQVKQMLAQQSGIKPVSAQPSAAAATCSSATAVATHPAPGVAPQRANGVAPQPAPGVALQPALTVAIQPALAAASNPVPDITTHPVPAATAASAPVPAAEPHQAPAAEPVPEAAAGPAPVAVVHQAAAPQPLPAEAAKKGHSAKRLYRKRQDARRRQQAREADEADDVSLPLTSSYRRRRKRKQKVAERAAEAGLGAAAEISGDDIQDHKRQRVTGPAAAAAAVAAAGQSADPVMVRLLLIAHALHNPKVCHAQIFVTFVTYGNCQHNRECTMVRYIDSAWLRCMPCTMFACITCFGSCMLQMVCWVSMLMLLPRMSASCLENVCSPSPFTGSTQ